MLHCHGFVLRTVHQIAVYCHYTVLLLFWILSYLSVKENVIVWLLILAVSMSNLEVVSELVFCGSFRFWGERVFFFYDW